MDTKKIKFVANRTWLELESPSTPGPIVKDLPQWYREADRFAVDPRTGEYPQMPALGGKIPTWKACPAVFDIMGTGYTFHTPCDIEFYEDALGNIQAKILEERYENFLMDRLPMHRFPHPPGYHQKHFAWWPDWSVELPDGYSALYSQPFNRFELPFLTMSGIVDNDKVHSPGTMPFFFMKGVTGILPKGTPYAQILPFKREHWLQETRVDLSKDEIDSRNQANAAKFRQPDGGVYLREVWERRKYQ